MTDPPNTAAAAVAALVTAAAAAALWLGVVPRLAEPVTDEPKLTYRRMVTARTGLIVALFSAAAGWLTWARLPLEAQPPWSVLSTLGIVLAAVDGYTTWIPARLTRWTWAVMAVGGALMLPLGADWTDLVRMVLGAAAAGGLYGLLWLATKASFGFGDVRFVPIVAAPAAAISWSMLIATLVAGSLLVLAHGVWHRIRRHPRLQPWAPGLTIGAYLMVLLTRAT